MYVPGIRAAVEGGAEEVTGQWIRGGEPQPIQLYLKDLSPEDREILLNGCLINTYKARARQ
jgi:aconitate hydratase